MNPFAPITNTGVWLLIGALVCTAAAMRCAQLMPIVVRRYGIGAKAFVGLTSILPYLFGVKVSVLFSALSVERMFGAAFLSDYSGPLLSAYSVIFHFPFALFLVEEVHQYSSRESSARSVIERTRASWQTAALIRIAQSGGIAVLVSWHCFLLSQFMVTTPAALDIYARSTLAVFIQSSIEDQQEGRGLLVASLYVFFVLGMAKASSELVTRGATLMLRRRPNVSIQDTKEGALVVAARVVSTCLLIFWAVCAAFVALSALTWYVAGIPTYIVNLSQVGIGFTGMDWSRVGLRLLCAVSGCLVVVALQRGLREFRWLGTAGILAWVPPSALAILATIPRAIPREIVGAVGLTFMAGLVSAFCLSTFSRTSYLFTARRLRGAGVSWTTRALLWGAAGARPILIATAAAFFLLLTEEGFALVVMGSDFIGALAPRRGIEWSGPERLRLTSFLTLWTALIVMLNICTSGMRTIALSSLREASIEKA